jgi:cobalamin-dependent methionine synthase I
MEKIDGESATKILLATVQGDVHDIGKNLVDIILSNNGYTVYNIGIKMPVEAIIEKAREYSVDMIGLSGLLVKSALVMQESMAQYQEAGLRVPILLGGAAACRPMRDQWFTVPMRLPGSGRFSSLRQESSPPQSMTAPRRLSL